MKYLTTITAALLMTTSGAAFATQVDNEAAKFDVFCRSLPDAHTVEEVEYQPGVDVNGKAVVPADVNAPLNAAVSNPVSVPITVDLAQRFSLLLANGLEMKPNVGTLDIYKDGRVSYNGQDISRQAYMVCAKNMGVRETTIVPAQEVNAAPTMPANPPAAVAKVPGAVGNLATQVPAQAAVQGSVQANGQMPQKNLDLPIVPKIAMPEGQASAQTRATEQPMPAPIESAAPQAQQNTTVQQSAAANEQVIEGRYP